jgi:hypothetical protein
VSLFASFVLNTLPTSWLVLGEGCNIWSSSLCSPLTSSLQHSFPQHPQSIALP